MKTHTQDRETRSGLAAGRRRGGQNTQTNRERERETQRRVVVKGGREINLGSEVQGVV